MKKLAAVIAVLLAAVTTSVPTLATATGAAPDRTVKKFVLVGVDEDSFINGYVGTDKVKSNGKLVGYDSYTATLNGRTGLVARVALALHRGLVVVRLSPDGKAPGLRWTGPILYGAGKYKGIEGTATLATLDVPERGNRARLTLRYTLP